MDGKETIIDEILNPSSSENEAEIVHIIKNEGAEPPTVIDASLPDDDDQELEASGEMVFKVPALLMVNKDQKISVTLDEIRRRVGPPENLSQTMLLTMLRLSKEKGRDLKKTLARQGITKLTSKSSIISCFTKLTEKVAQLAEDYFYLASRHLQLKEINKEIVRSNGGWDGFAPQAKATKDLLQQVLRLIEAKDADLTQMTHGFSPLIIRAVIDIITEIITYRGV
ncbi:transcription factor aptf-1-like isoform X2 [Oratosquilla oratoria]|uniref:transcription factor aptf-1-like isoform X2 n=1 Tax=Oratosquilla oratoria TaxID=337810 RepID=UPI003F7691AA